MRYLIDGKVIRSENAAKSYKQKSKHVVNYLMSRTQSENVMDFGCGKLRYSSEIISIGKSVTFVDSELQLSRKQIVRGTYCNAIEYISTNYRNALSLSFEDASSQKINNHFDFISCTNVLSAIPCPDYLNKVLSLIHTALRIDGEALFVNHHRCSSFSKFQAGQRHMHGYIYASRSGFSYYGLMTNKIVIATLEPLGFEVIRSWSKEDIGFVLVRRSK